MTQSIETTAEELEVFCPGDDDVKMYDVELVVHFDWYPADPSVGIPQPYYQLSHWEIGRIQSYYDEGSIVTDEGPYLHLREPLKELLTKEINQWVNDNLDRLVEEAGEKEQSEREAAMENEMDRKREERG